MGVNLNRIDQTNFENDEISLKELVLKIILWLDYLKSKWIIILFITFLSAFIGLIYSFVEKPNFKAVLTFAMEEDKGGSGGLSGALGIANSFGIDLSGAGGGGAFAASNLTELMKSRLIVEKVLLNPIRINNKTTTLAEYFINVNKLRKEWSKKSTLRNIQFLPGSDRTKFSLQQDSILSVFHKQLIEKDYLNIMQKDKKVTILTIEVTSKDELFSKLFCENLAKETSNFYIETKSRKSKINVEVLQKQADSIKNELNGAINRVAIESDNVFNLNPALNIKTATSKKKQVDVQANTAILTNILIQLELAKITLRKETPLIQLIDSPILPLEIDKTTKLKGLLLGLFFGFVLSCLFLLVRMFFKKILE